MDPASRMTRVPSRSISPDSPLLERRTQGGSAAADVFPASPPPQAAPRDLRLIEELIRRRFAMRVHNFHVSSVPGGLVLEGRTKTTHGRQLILQAVMDLSGLPILANKITAG